MKRKVFAMQVTVTAPAWMNKRQAIREVRTLINHQANFMSYGPNGQDVGERTIHARGVK